MATNDNGPLDGAGSILSSIAGPSDPTPPTSLGQRTAETGRLLEKVSEDAELAAERPFNATKALEYGIDAYTPHRGETHDPTPRWPRPARRRKTSLRARPATARRTSARIPSMVRWTACVSTIAIAN